MEHASNLDRLCVVLVATRNPLNIGAAARAMSNFGVHDFRLVNPFEPSFREARSAVGASAILQGARVFDSLAGAVADRTLVVGTTAARDREVEHPIRTPAEASPMVHEHLGSGRVAVVFGSEKRGLSNDDLSHCHWLIRIPTREVHGSMNLGQSVAVCMYELARATAPTAQGNAPQPTHSADLERITAQLCEALRHSGYTKAGAEAATEDKVRRLVRRLNLQGADAELLLGMIAKIATHLQRNRHV